MRRALTVAALAVLGTAVLVGVGASAGPKQIPSKQAFAAHLLASRNAVFFSPAARNALAILASGNRTARADFDRSTFRVGHGSGKLHTSGSGLKNIQVNDPSQDKYEVDQTTQSETSIAVSGKNLVIGYNDSKQAIPGVLTAGLNFDGYSTSSDGGATFKDRESVPNPPGLNNLGDPWLASDRSGAIYYSSLALDYENNALPVGVSKSTDGGKTWSQQTVASPTDDLGYFADKDAMAVGPDPTDTSKDIVYDTWDDQFFDEDGNFHSGLPVSRSLDGGASWEVNYADVFTPDPDGCSFAQYIGAMPAVASNGTLYVAAERASVDDPDCTGEGSFVMSEVVFTSQDGGQTFDSGTQLAEVTGVNYLDLGPGSLMRNLSFPSIAVGPDGNVYVAWNDSDPADETDTSYGPTNISLATSTDGGGTWDVSPVTSGTNDAVQPALSVDSNGVHILYYLRNDDATLDVLVANGNPAAHAAGSPWTTTRVTSRSFPGSLTVPQADPQIADAYMGDYIANVSDGKNQYFAWGDNRSVLKDFMFPDGRPDPNVEFAKQSR